MMMRKRSRVGFSIQALRTAQHMDKGPAEGR